MMERYKRKRLTMKRAKFEGTDMEEGSYEVIRKIPGNYHWFAECGMWQDEGVTETYLEAATLAGAAAEKCAEMEMMERWTVTDPEVKRGGAA